MDAYDLNLRHVRMLGEIARAGSLSTAARNAGISQPALSQALARIEDGLGEALFHRSPDGVTVTSFGRRVVPRLEQASATLAQSLRGVSRGGRAQPERCLTIAHVRGLICIAEAGSFVGAAALARLSTPTVHRAVRDLEDLCAAMLLERRGRGVGLTLAGTKLVRGFTLGMAQLAAAIDEARPFPGRLAIGAMALSRSLLLPAALADLITAMPDAQVDVVEGSYLELAEFLRSGRIDVMIGALRAHAPNDLRQQALFDDRLTIIGRAGHPLARAGASYDDLAAYPWIVARRASGLLERWQQLFDRIGKTRPRAPIQCGSVALIRGLLVRSDFLTLLSADQVEAEIEAGLLTRIRSPIPDTSRTIGAITRRDWHPTALQRQFMAVLETCARQRWPDAQSPPD